MEMDVKSFFKKVKKLFCKKSRIFSGFKRVIMILSKSR